MGHAVYSLSDPRERIFKGFVEQLSAAKHRERDMTLYNNIEELAPEIIAQKRKIYKGVSPNVDFYSGFVYDMLGIPVELYTPFCGSPYCGVECSSPGRDCWKWKDHPTVL